MKKFLSYLLTAAMFFGTFAGFLVPAKSAVEGSDLDQSYENLSSKVGSTTIANYPDRAQTFKPSRNTITSIDVHLVDRKADSNITLKLQKETESGGWTTVHTSTHTLLSPPAEGWETFAFLSPYITVAPGQTYAINLEVDDYQTKWSYGSEGYANGEFLLNSSRDAYFRVYGKNVEGQPSSVAEDKETEKQAYQEVEVDTEINSPELTYIEKNGELIEDSLERVEVTSGDRLVVGGTAPENTRVVLFVGEETFSAEVDDAETWVLGIVHADLNEGEYKVEAQAQESEERGSEKVELFTLEKILKEDLSQEKELSLWEKIIGPWEYITYATLLALLLLMLLVLHFTQRKHLAKHANKGKKDDDKVDLSQLDKLEKSNSKPKKGTRRVIDITK